MASAYAFIASCGCLAIAFTQGRLAKKTKSPLLQVDTKNWLVDGILSLAVAVAFIVTLLLVDSRFAYLIPYTDPSVVIVLVLLSLPIPWTIIRENWNQLVGKAPDVPIQRKARAAIQAALAGTSRVETSVRLQRLGRLHYVQLYIVCRNRHDQGLNDFDACRKSVANALADVFEPLPSM